MNIGEPINQNIKQQLKHSIKLHVELVLNDASVDILFDFEVWGKLDNEISRLLVFNKSMQWNIQWD